jgi:hypothetical protein
MPSISRGFTNIGGLLIVYVSRIVGALFTGQYSNNKIDNNNNNIER